MRYEYSLLKLNLNFIIKIFKEMRTTYIVAAQHWEISEINQSFRIFSH